MPRLARALALLAALAAGGAPGSARAAPPPLFGTAEQAAGAPTVVPQWRGVREAIAREEAIVARCARDPAACVHPEVGAWLAFLRQVAGRPPLEQVRAVHRFFNRRPYRPDAENYGTSDRWATPLQFLTRAGDCEDYAIAKYESLRRLGFAAEQLRLVVLHDTARDLVHAVLAVYLPEGVVVLDNLTEEILPQERLTRYRPYYSLNEAALWLHEGQGAGPVAAGGGTLRR